MSSCSPLYSVAKFSTKPLELAKNLRVSRFILNDQYEIIGIKDPNCFASEVGSRSLFLLQAITSIVALPIVLILGILESVFRLFTSGGEVALGTLRATIGFTTMTLLGTIPSALLSIFLTKNASNNVSTSINDFATKVGMVTSCYTCSDQED